jgi:hypothetical protein
MEYLQTRREVLSMLVPGIRGFGALQVSEQSITLAGTLKHQGQLRTLL